MRILSPSEQDKLLDLPIQKLGIRNWTILRVMLWTGIRVSELVGLNFEDVFYQTEPKRICTLRPEITKGGKSREIPISEKLRYALRDYYRDRALSGVTVGIDPDRPLFTGHRNTLQRLTTRQVQRIIGVAGQDVGIQGLHPHLLRHTFATTLLRATDTRTVQIILGHANLGSTQIYCHPSSEDLVKAVNRL